jgi:hypothetical protein
LRRDGGVTRVATLTASPHISALTAARRRHRAGQRFVGALTGHVHVGGGGDDDPSRMRVRSMTGGSWNGARFAPPGVLPPRPDGAPSKTVLLADQTGHA